MEGEILKISGSEVHVKSFRTDQVAYVELSNVTKHLWEKQRTVSSDQEQQHFKKDVVKVEDCLASILKGKVFKPEVENNDGGDVSSFGSFEAEKFDDGGEISSCGSFEADAASVHSDSSSEDSAEDNARIAVFELEDIPVGSSVMVRDGYKAVNIHHAKIMAHVSPSIVEIQWLGRGDRVSVSIAKVREKIAEDAKGRRTKRKIRRFIEEGEATGNVKKVNALLLTPVSKKKELVPKKRTKKPMTKVAHRNKRARASRQL
jgi:hypothetical protein